MSMMIADLQSFNVPRSVLDLLGFFCVCDFQDVIIGWIFLSVSTSSSFYRHQDTDGCTDLSQGNYLGCVMDSSHFLPFLGSGPEGDDAQ